jgi:hypothetical protein
VLAEAANHLVLQRCSFFDLRSLRAGGFEHFVGHGSAAEILRSDIARECLTASLNKSSDNRIRLFTS